MKDAEAMRQVRNLLNQFVDRDESKLGVFSAECTVGTVWGLTWPCAPLRAIRTDDDPNINSGW